MKESPVYWEERNGIVVPVASPDLWRLFVDETYLAGGTGFLQAAILVPDGWYRRVAVPEAARLLRQLGTKARRFKASRLSRGNRRIYEQFLQLFINGLAEGGLGGRVHSIVGVDGPQFCSSTDLNVLIGAINRVFSEYGVTAPAPLVKEYATQFLWLVRHGRSIVTRPIQNPLAISFDARHRYAQEVRALVAVRSRSGIALIWRLGSLFTRMANTPMIRDYLRVGSINDIDFRWSRSEFGLQAADLFTNLHHATLRYELGARDDATVLRYRVFSAAVPSFHLDAALRGKLRFQNDRLECRDPQLCSRWQLDVQ